MKIKIKYGAIMSHLKNIKIIAAMLFMAAHIMAMQYDGDPIPLSQPDGSEVTVHLFGTSFFATAESPDGYTLIRDANGWICYAELSADGSEYVSTGVRYTGTSRAPVSIRKGLRISEKSMMEKRSKNIKTLGDGEEEAERRFRDKVEKLEKRDAARGGGLNRSAAPYDEGDAMPAPWVLPDTVTGIALFISFPDYPAPTGDTYTRWLRHADSVYNSPAYTRGSGAGAGSVWNYFRDISDENMLYRNVITVFIEATNTFEYYDGADNYGRVQELITDVLTKLRDDPAYTDVRAEITSRVSRHPGTRGNKSRPAYALNIHPIRSGQRWSHGIWSHRGWYRGNVTVGGVPLYDYQFSGLGNSGTVTSATTLSTGVIIHENGHMLFDWPDLYSYVGGRTFVNNYCTMASGTVMPNPFFRDLEGWVAVTDVTAAPGNYTHNANTNTAFVYRRTGITGNNANAERYYIESRFSSGRSSGIPGTGLIIWHVHTGGNNSDYDPASPNAARRTPRVAIIQANGGTGSPGANSPFTNANGRNVFDSTTTPRARWHTASGAVGELWNGPNNGLRVSNVSAAPTTSNPWMTFTIGYGNDDHIVTPPAEYVYTLSVTGGGTGGGDYEAGTNVDVSAPATRAVQGQTMYFVRWSSSSEAVIPADIYNPQTQSVTTIAANATLTPNYGRAHPIPATAAIPRIEGDTAAFAQTVASETNADATGGRLGAFFSVGDIAEYAVNVTAAGTYKFKYRVMTNGGSVDRAFRLVDVTNGVTLDSVMVPRSTVSDTHQELTEISGNNVVQLKEGIAVWQIESTDGPAAATTVAMLYLDWFAAEPAKTTLTVVGGTFEGCAPNEDGSECSGDFNYGDVVNVTANPPPKGYEFVVWEGGGEAIDDSTNPQTSIMIAMGDNIVLAAVFEASTSVKPGSRGPLAFDLKAGSAGRINYSVANAEAVSIRVYDIRGRVVATLASGVLTPGHYSVSLSQKRLGKGVYLVRMRSASFAKDVRLNYVK